MPVPNPAEVGGYERPSRLPLQLAVFACYLAVAVVLWYHAWLANMRAEGMEHLVIQQGKIVEQQGAILNEIRDARVTIPAQVKSAIPDALKGVAK